MKKKYAVVTSLNGPYIGSAFTVGGGLPRRFRAGGNFRSARAADAQAAAVRRSGYYAEVVRRVPNGWVISRPFDYNGWEEI